MTVALLLHRTDGASPTTSFRRAAFGPADPLARNREIAWEGPNEMSAGRVSFTGDLDVARFPHIETLVVVEGELTLTVAGEAPLVLGPQAGAVIGCGTALHIQAAARAVAARIRAGQVHINNPPWSPEAPFGGYKRSGNGREYGVEGLEEYLETKAILGYMENQAPAAA